jgi:hypothetical protein
MHAHWINKFRAEVQRIAIDALNPELCCLRTRHRQDGFAQCVDDLRNGLANTTRLTSAQNMAPLHMAQGSPLA